MAAALEEFALEASLLKVASSEMVDFVVDENVQIHGGNGFVADYPAERRYRDARVNRIFEGTNEINRLLVPGILIKRGTQGRAAAGRRGQGRARRVDDAWRRRTSAADAGLLATETPRRRRRCARRCSSPSAWRWRRGARRCSTNRKR